MRNSALDEFVQNLLTKAGRLAARSRFSIAAAEREIRTLTETDYEEPVRKAFGRAEVNELIAEARRFVWPNLNRQALKIVSPREFITRYRDLGIQVKFAKPSDDAAGALLGFYIRESPQSKRPLIWVNSSKHHAVSSAAFTHEMGHHVSAEIFGDRAVEPELFLYTGYANHLRETREIAADMFVSVGCLPRPVMVKFLAHWNRARKSKRRIVMEALRYFNDRYQVRFDGSLSPADELQCLTGILHYIKLRRAILLEFDI